MASFVINSNASILHLDLSPCIDHRIPRYCLILKICHLRTSGVRLLRCGSGRSKLWDCLGGWLGRLLSGILHCLCPWIVGVRHLLRPVFATISYKRHRGGQLSSRCSLKGPQTRHKILFSDTSWEGPLLPTSNLLWCICLYFYYWASLLWFLWHFYSTHSWHPHQPATF